MSFRRLQEKLKAIHCDETDPHEYCQECYYNYPYILQRVLEPKIAGSVHVASDKLGVGSNLEYNDFFGSRARSSENMPAPSDAECAWQNALIHAKLTLPELVDGQERPFPSLIYLAQISLWENMRYNENVEDKIEELPISDQLKKHLIYFFKQEEKCMQKHICGKFSKLLVSGEFLSTL